jgi:hypothetical protein
LIVPGLLPTLPKSSLTKKRLKPAFVVGGDNCYSRRH